MSEWTFSFDELVEVNFDAPGVPGRKGDPGEGLPAGGTTGQFVRKASTTDYDTEWVDVDAASVGADPAGSAAAAQAAAVATAQGYTDGVSAADRVYIDNEIAGLAPVASSGAYSDLTGRPTLGTAAAQNTTAFATAAQGAKADTAIQDDDLGTSAYLDVPATGNALTTQVVKGNDSRLSNARPPTAHTHTKSDISDFSDGDYATAAQGALADSASQPGHAHDISDLNTTGTPDGTKFLRDDGSWQVVSAGGGAVDSVNGETGVVVLDADDIDDSATVNKFATAAQLAAADSASQPGHAHTKSDISDFSDGDYATAAQGTLADSASQPGHTHTEAEVTDLGSYPDATGQPATKLAQTDGADGWTFVDPPSGGSGYAPDPSAQPDGKWLTTASGAYVFTDAPAGGGTTTIGPGDWQAPTLEGTWASYTDPEYGDTPGYRKDSFGMVHMKGLVQYGSGTIFTLPEGYRPAENLKLPMRGNTVGMLGITAAGVVTANIPIPSLYVSFLSADAAPITVAGSGGTSVSIPTFTATHAAGISTLRWYNDTGSSITIAGARATLSADAVDAATVVDVNVDDVTALDAPISIAVGTRTTKVTDEIVVPADSYLTVDVDSVGTPGAGETLSVQFYT